MGFDYLRDNMVIYKENKVQRGHALRHRRRGGLHPHRRGPHPADHLRPGRQVHRPLCAWPTDFASTPEDVARSRDGRRRRRQRRPRTPTTSWTRRRETATLTRPGRRRRRSSTSTWKTCWTPRTSTLLAPHQPGHQGPRRHDSGTWTMWSRTARSSSSTSSPAV